MDKLKKVRVQTDILCLYPAYFRGKCPILYNLKKR
jgi:hypothetical protein